MGLKKLVLTIPLFFLIVILGFVLFNQGTQFLTLPQAEKTVIPSRPSPTTTPDFAFSSLILNPVSSTQILGKPFVLEVMLDSAQNQVTGAEVYLRFDPQKLAVEKITPGNFWGKPNILLEKTDSQNGLISYAIGGLTAKNGKNVLFKLTLKPLSLTDSQTPTLISFNPQTKIADINQTSSVLKSTQGAEISILPKQ